MKIKILLRSTQAQTINCHLFQLEHKIQQGKTEPIQPIRCVHLKALNQCHVEGNKFL